MVVVTAPNAPLSLPVNMPPESTISCMLDSGEKYGLVQSEFSAALKIQLGEFKMWASSPVQSNRVGKAPQQQTVANNLNQITAFLGWARTFLGKQAKDMGLQTYMDGATFLAFIQFFKVEGLTNSRSNFFAGSSLENANSYLPYPILFEFPQVKSLSLSHVESHINTFKKVLTFIKVKVSEKSPSYHPLTVEEVEKTLEWMRGISPQLSSLFPAQTKAAPTLFKTVVEWVDDRLREALEIMGTPGFRVSNPSCHVKERKRMADRVQGGIIACLGSGRFLPPMRAGIIRSLRDGSKHVIMCTDEDCQHPFECQGNIMSITEEERVRVFIPHHKTERHTSVLVSGPIDVLLPPGPLTDLLLWWMRMGWTEAYNTITPRPLSDLLSLPLFMKPAGTPFSSSELSNYWLKQQPKDNTILNKITLTDCRTSFVEAYTACERNELKWEGTAYLMGNTSQRWSKSYAPTLKRRRMQDAADAHAGVLARGGGIGGVGAGPSSGEGGSGDRGWMMGAGSSAAAFVGASSSSPAAAAAAGPSSRSGRGGERGGSDDDDDYGLGSESRRRALDLQAFEDAHAAGGGVNLEVAVSSSNRFGYASRVDWVGLDW
jgi:hypothetical protein